MKKNFWVNEMVNFGSALTTPYFPSEDDLLTLTGAEVMTSHENPQALETESSVI